MSKQKKDRNQRLYQYWLKNPNMGYSAIGRVFKHTWNGQLVPLDASAVYRIIKREEKNNGQ